MDDQQYQQIKVPGIGTVSFPAEMSQDDIVHAIETDILPRVKQPQAPASPSPAQPQQQQFDANSIFKQTHFSPIQNGAYKTPVAPGMLGQVADKAGIDMEPIHPTPAPSNGGHIWDQLKQGLLSTIGATGDGARIEMGQDQQGNENTLKGAQQAGMINFVAPKDAWAQWAGRGANMLGASLIPDLVTGGMAAAPMATIARSALSNSALTGAASMTADKLLPGSDLAQLVAGMAKPGFDAALAGSKRMITGNPAQYRANIDTLNKAGISDVNLGNAGGTVAKGLLSLVNKLPGGDGPIGRNIANQHAQVEDKYLGIAKDLSPVSTPEGAGDSLQADVSNKNPSSFANKIRDNWDKLSNKFVSNFKPDETIKLDNTMQTLNDLSKSVDGADSTSHLLINGLIKDLQGSLREDTSPTQVAAVPANSTDRGVFDKNGNPVTLTDQGNTPAIPGKMLEYTVHDAYDGEKTIQQPAAGPAGQGYPERRFPQRIVQDGKDFVEGADNPQIPLSAADRIKRMIGQKLAGLSPLIDGENKGIYEKVYKSLSDDFRSKAESVGGSALNDFNNQNNYYTAARNRLENFIDPLAAKTNAGAAFTSLFNQSKVDGNKLWAVRRSVDPQTWKDQVATWMDSNGRSKPGSDWNLNTLMQNYNNLSPQAKAAMFGGKGMINLIQEMENLKDAHGILQDTAKAGVNPSGSAQGMMKGGITALALQRIFSGDLTGAAALGGIVPTVNITARAMTNPIIVRMLGQIGKLPESQLPGHLARLNAAIAADNKMNPAPAQQATPATTTDPMEELQAAINEGRANDPVTQYANAAPVVSPKYKELQPHLAEASKQTGVDNRYLSAILNNEALKKNGQYLTSSVGAVGPMQVKPDTAKDYGVNGNDLRDPRTNVLVGAAHYRHMLDLFSDPVKAAAAYNMGEGAFKRLETKYGTNWEQHLPTETSRYVANFRKQTQ